MTRRTVSSKSKGVEVSLETDLTRGGLERVT